MFHDLLMCAMTHSYVMPPHEGPFLIYVCHDSIHASIWPAAAGTARTDSISQKSARYSIGYSESMFCEFLHVAVIQRSFVGQEFLTAILESQHTAPFVIENGYRANFLRSSTRGSESA